MGLETATAAFLPQLNFKGFLQGNSAVLSWRRDCEVFKRTSVNAACTHTLARHEGFPHASLCEPASNKSIANPLSKKIRDTNKVAASGLSLFNACLHKYKVVGCDCLLHFSCRLCKLCLKGATTYDQIGTGRES